MSKALLHSLVKKCSMNRFYVLDTETLGLGNNAVICNLGIITSEGETLLDTLVNPKLSIPKSASAVHKITDEMVIDAPTWPEIASKVAEIVAGQYVVIYNTSFDLGAMTVSDSHAGGPFRNWYESYAKEWLCAMRAYAAHNGEWRKGAYKWKPLSDAASRLKVPTVNAHSALGDCHMALGVVRGLIALYANAKAEGQG